MCDPPGFVDCHSHLEYAVYAGFGDGLPFSSWIGLHVARKALLDLDDMRAIATDALTPASARGSPPSATAASPEPPQRRPRRRACARSSSSRSSAATGPRWTGWGPARSASSACSPKGSPSAYRRTRRTPAPSSCTRRAPASACRPRRTSRRASPSASSSSAVRATGPRSPRCSCRRPAARASACCAGAGLLGPGLVAAHCVHVEDDEIALLAQHGVGVAHCPRSNGILGCGIAPLARLLDAGIPVGIATDSPASTPRSTSSRSCGRPSSPPAPVSSHGRMLPAHTALELATSAVPGFSGSTPTSARSLLASGPT